MRTRHNPPSCPSQAPQHARYGAAVTDSAKERSEQVRFVLTTPPPLRSLAISSVSAVIAAAMIVFGTALELPQAVAVVGIGLMVFAVVLAVVALLLTARLRTILILDPQSISITRGRYRRVVPWSMVQTVKMQGPRLLLVTARRRRGQMPGRMRRLSIRGAALTPRLLPCLPKSKGG